MNDPAPYRILLVCSGNTCRSSMAEAILRDALSRQWPAGLERIEVHSAGTSAAAGLPASAHAVAALREMSLDISGHSSRPATPEVLRQAALVLTMTRGHKAQVERLLEDAAAAGAPPESASAPRVFTLLEYAYQGGPEAQQDIEDPFGASVDTYRATAAVLAQAIDRVVQRLQREFS